MEVSGYLGREGEHGAPAGQIAFAGERFDVMRVRTWRDALLAGGALSQLMT